MSTGPTNFTILSKYFLLIRSGRPVAPPPGKEREIDLKPGLAYMPVIKGPSGPTLSIPLERLRRLRRPVGDSP
jgi:hypothetical protein